MGDAKRRMEAGHYPTSADRPRILVAPLCGTERDGWVNPELSIKLIEMVKDPRFDVTVQPIVDIRPFEHARNLAVVRARDGGFDWCFQIDNDISFQRNPLDWLRSGKDVIAQAYFRYEGSSGIQMDIRGEIYAKDSEGFAHVEAVGTGAMMISSKVWHVIPHGPWFRHLTNEESELADYKLAESFYFCKFIAQHGLKVWCPPEGALHFHTAELGWVGNEIARQVQKKRSQGWTQFQFGK